MAVASHVPSTPPAEPRRGVLESFRPPAGTATFAVAWVVLGLAIAFAALIVAYVVTRHRLGVEAIGVPAVFWFSTFFVLVSSLTLQSAAMAAALGHAWWARRALLGSAALGVLFLVLQVPGLVLLMGEHGDAPRSVYAFTLVLVLLHAAHLIGGLIPLIAFAAPSRSLAPPEARRRLRPLLVYWHFLTVVWLVMFNVFLLA